MKKYRIEKSLGKGGMGEVFLAFDPVCERHVALKQIRKDLLKYPRIRERFLREAKIASQLAHPAIIPIYDRGETYYTMPYVEGKTLNKILKSSSIPSLIPHFLKVCQAIAYVHAKGILHCDLKPENIIVGKYGEVLILDWGLTEFIKDEPLPTKKTVGTLAYMAPERALGERATVLTDIYALGVILYLILTLKFPFVRSSLENYPKECKHEELIPPLEAAPYRDIPIQLNDIAIKCLAVSKKERYQSVDEMIKDLQAYLEGTPAWVFSTSLNIKHKKDWKFQENILLAKHIALTKSTKVMEWVSLMIGKPFFAQNLKLQTHFKLASGGKGIGFLLSIPNAHSFKEGYFLWLGGEVEKGITLFRSDVEVFHLPENYLEENKEYKITIVKEESYLQLYLDDLLILNYLSLLPLLGNHVGVIAKDSFFEMQKIDMLERSFNVMVKCLAVPDALMAAKQYDQALDEYRRIAQSFYGRTEGREALFKAGLTLLEKGLFNESLLEFEKLHKTPSAPLEYLGKSLVYKAEKNIEEESKCLELCFRKFSKHPLITLIIEHVMLRLHEAAYTSRLEAYHFALMALRYFPQRVPEEIIEILTSHSEELPFFNKQTDLCVKLAFWLAKPLVLQELGAVDVLQKLIKKEKDLKLATDWKDYPSELLRDDNRPEFSLYGCYLCKKEGKQSALNHFAWVNETPFPKTTALLAHYLLGKIDFKKGAWAQNAFFWEKVYLLKELILFYHCAGDEKQVNIFKRKLNQEYKRVKAALHPDT